LIFFQDIVENFLDFREREIKRPRASVGSCGVQGDDLRVFVGGKDGEAMI
jgi:hypothetical protein